MTPVFPWHKFWLLVAIGSLLFGALGIAILTGLASWYCWPR